MWVPTNVCGCCEDIFTIFILTIIVIFIRCCSFAKTIGDACSQEDEKEKAKARVQTRLIIEERSDGYHLVWRNENTKTKP